MEEKKFNFHYHFSFRWIPGLFLGHYDIAKSIIDRGPSSLRNYLRQKWEEEAVRLTDRYENLELLNNKDLEYPFDFSLVQRAGKPDIFSIYMPPMAPPVNAIECLVISVIMNETEPDIFVCNYDDYTIQKMKAAGAPPEYSEPHFIVEKITKEGISKIGNCQKFSEFFAIIDNI